jgi:uncharacterized membrane protein
VQDAAVALLSALAVGLWLLRGRWLPGRFDYLLWNLALAWVPWCISRAVAASRTAAAALALPAWLVFLPNAPYLVTDLVHLRARAPVPLWFDALLFGGFALAGCALGWTSLAQVRGWLAGAMGPRAVELVLAPAALLTGFGVYLGRFQRWNSWDLWTRPGALLDGALDALLLPRALAFSALFGLFVWAGYLLVRSRGAPTPAAGTPT